MFHLLGFLLFNQNKFIYSEHTLDFLELKYPYIFRVSTSLPINHRSYKYFIVFYS